MVVSARALLAIIPLLAGCSAELFPALDSRIDEAPMSDESRSALRAYFNKPNAKAFVFSAETGQNWHAWGYDSADEAVTISLSKCEELTGTRCTTFARNETIVWQSPNVQANTPTAATASTSRAATAEVNMRSGPGTSFKVVGVLGRGEIIETTGVEGVWFAVRRADNSVGYVHGDYLGPVANAPIEPASTGTRLSSAELRTLRAEADRGSVDAQFDLGNRYLHAFGVSKDIVEAREWFLKAAAQGHPVAAYELGLMYEKGTGIEPNASEARRWFQQGANAGHGPSQNKLR